MLNISLIWPSIFVFKLAYYKSSKASTNKAKNKVQKYKIIQKIKDIIIAQAYPLILISYNQLKKMRAKSLFSFEKFISLVIKQ